MGSKVVEKKDVSSSRILDRGIKVVFVLGGPGSGKGTQCEKIAKKFGFTHLSSGDLLRAECKSGSEYGEMVENLMKEGKLAPADLVVRLIQKAMVESGNDKFLIDGFPRSDETRVAFEKIVKIEPEFVLFLDCPEHELERRILNRNQGREDDNIETIRKRFKVFMESTLPVIKYYEERRKVKKVDGAKSIEEVSNDIKALFTSFQDNENENGYTDISIEGGRFNLLKRWLHFLCGCFKVQERTRYFVFSLYIE